MIKLILKLLLVLHLLLGLSANAQNFKFGLIVGIDLSKSHMIIKTTENTLGKVYPIAALNLNGFVSFKSSEFWGISVEPGFIQKGGKIKDKTSDFKYLYNYLQLPILGNLFVSKRFYVSIGPEVCYMIKSHFTRKFELSGLVGINYQLTDKFDIGMKYNHGLTYLYEDKFIDNSGELIQTIREYNQYFQLALRYKI